MFTQNSEVALRCIRAALNGLSEKGRGHEVNKLKWTKIVREKCTNFSVAHAVVQRADRERHSLEIAPVLPADWCEVRVSNLWHGTSAWRLSAAGVLVLRGDLTSILKPALSPPGGLPRSAHSPRASSFTGKLSSERKAQICKSEKKKKNESCLAGFARLRVSFGTHTL